MRLAPPHPPFKRRIRSTASQRAVYPRKTDECLPSSGPNFPVDSLAAATTKLHGNSINSIRETRVQFEISTPIFQTKRILLMDDFFFLNLRIFFLNLRIVDLMGERSCCEPLRSCSRFLEVCAKRLCKFELVEKLISGGGLIRITNVWFLSSFSFDRYDYFRDSACLIVDGYWRTC